MNITGMKLVFALSVAVLLSGVWGCGIVRDDDMVVVARIGKEKIYAGDLSHHIALMPFEQKAKMQEREPRLAVLSQMVERRILLAEADKLAIQTTPPELMDTLRRYLQSQGDPQAGSASPEQLAAMLDESVVEMPSATTLQRDYDFSEQDVESMRVEQTEKKRDLRRKIEEAARIRKLLVVQASSLVQVTDEDILNL